MGRPGRERFPGERRTLQALILLSRSRLFSGRGTGGRSGVCSLRPRLCAAGAGNQAKLAAVANKGGRE